MFLFRVMSKMQAAKYLGHNSLEMVKEYVNMFGEDLKENFEKFNPINQFMNDSKGPIQII